MVTLAHELGLLELLIGVRKSVAQFAMRHFWNFQFRPNGQIEAG